MSPVRASVRSAVQLAALVVVVGGAFAWNEGFFHDRIDGSQARRPTGKAYPGPTLVLRQEPFPTILEVAGTVRAHRTALISARMVAVIDRIEVDEGDRVRAGQTLVALSAPDLDSRRSAAAGAVDAARAAREQARRDLDRMERLFERGVVPRSQKERAETDVRRAEADLARASGEAQASASMARYTILPAPFDGVVARRRADAGTMAAPGAPILELVDDSAFRVEAEVGETAAASARPGDLAEIVLGDAAAPIAAPITEVVPAADPRSRTVLVKIALEPGAGMRDGLFARVRLRIGERLAVAVPRAVVRRVGEIAVVDVVTSDGAVEPRYVRLGAELADGRQEILAGVAEGERIVAPR